MKIMNQITIRYLKENKKRTIFTLLCITISVMMVSFVGITFSSVKEFFQDYIVQTNGNYHYVIQNNDVNILNILNNDDEIDEYYMNSFDLLYDINNEKFIMYTNFGDMLYFLRNNYSKNIIEGRLPENPQEIVLSQSYLKMFYNKKTIGDKIDFYISQDNKKVKKTFQIVGTTYTTNINGQEYNAISYIDVKNTYSLNIYVRDKDESNHIFQHISRIKKQYDKELSYEYNYSYLESIDIFEKNSQSMYINIYKIIAIIMFIIIFISYFIIYQAFHLSTYDRIQYLGMLSSVGATPRQKKHSIYFEGLLLSIIAIPLGIIISFTGLSIAFFFINQMSFLKSMSLSIHTNLSLEYLGMIIILSLLTITISLYIPARKISKISVIDALNKSDEIKVKKKKLKQNKFLKKILNINQQFVLKNYKRQGKRSKIIVFSLVASMIIFISVYSFGKLLMINTSQLQLQYPYQVNCYIANEDQNLINQYLQNNENINDYMAYQNIAVNIDIDNDYVSDKFFSEDGIDMNIEFIGVDQKTYQQICQDNHIQAQEKQILLFNTPYYNEESHTYIQKKYKEMDKKFIKSIFYVDSENQLQELSSFNDIQLIQKDNYDLDSENSFCMIVPLKITSSLDISQSIEYKIQTQDHETITNELNAMNFNAYDHAQYMQQNQQITYIISFFIYSFVLIIIFFALLNIMNMMSASIEKRKKEFGMMLSVGMSPHQIQKMIFYESFIYGIKTFIYGVPICLFIEWILYMQMDHQSVFTPSWIAYMISFIVIMLVMLLTFRIGLQRFEKQNIIETLKDDM